MKTMMGIKVLELSDIVRTDIEMVSICKQAKEMYEKDKTFLTLIDENSFVSTEVDKVMLKYYRFEFVPREVIEERIFYYLINSAMDIIERTSLSAIQQNRASELVDRHERSYKAVEENYNYSEYIYNTECLLFAFDENDNLENVSIEYPNSFLSRLAEENTVYKCASCGKKEKMSCENMDTFAPPMRYEVVNDQINYYCEQCQKENPELKKLKKVGE